MKQDKPVPGFNTAQTATAGFKKTPKTPGNNKELLVAAFENIAIGVCLTAPNGSFIEVNETLCDMLGYAKEELVQKKFTKFTHPDDVKKNKEWFQKMLAGRKVPSYMEKRYVHKDGHPIWTYVSTKLIKSPAGNPLCFVTSIMDITKRKEMEEELKMLSLTDELTRLTNRRGFYTLAEQQIKIANRLKQRMFLLYADIDNFKRINDTFGHRQGDIALKETAALLKKTFRESDIIARIGGDEFIILSIENSGENDNKLIARLKKTLQVRNSKHGLKYNLSLSTGIAHYDPEHPLTHMELIDSADKEMYRNKKNG